MNKKTHYLFRIATLVALAICLWPSPSTAAWRWNRGQFFVIGTGPAGPRMATMQALETIKQMDVIIANDKHAKLFADYIGDKPILFDPWTGIWNYKGKKRQDLNKEELAKFRVERFKIRDERVQKIKDLLAEGKDVGLLDSGNPCLYGPSHWYSEHFDQGDLVIIPGMGCDAAAMAAIGQSTIPSYDTRFVMQASPFFLRDQDLENRQILKDVFSKLPATMVFYMALRDPEKMFSTLGEMLPADMPCAVVFWAGYPDRQRIVRGTIADMAEKLSKEQEKFMGLLLVGRFLEGKPYEAAMKRGHAKLKQDAVKKRQ
ncbi:SAM-dependent methyltransferase [uncultured Desulfosarcina sp.]|uniref:SAM-dependent methyltransferase n=1 Tax=uncultured Desulfosarcina sp. TaxID=218289 RepID=UPI0029C85429|nr:SAM-dependent methyltransferase [uncultured Desulfosarcina sp.]